MFFWGGGHICGFTSLDFIFAANHVLGEALFFFSFCSLATTRQGGFSSTCSSVAQDAGSVELEAEWGKVAVPLASALGQRGPP